ncbi:hypothetical protein S40288_10004 [Stachybotrys chartarum IBT 40288]|nr:hypothetical protein S40288_10004 [Stachybotrys chartarum IBT 40288]
MATVIANYSSDHFNALPDIKTAHSRFVTEKGLDHVESLKDFFLNNGMDRQFGLIMVHRHFDLEPAEKLVEYRGTSTPWSCELSGLKKPQPMTWAFDEKNVLRPIEFRYSEVQDEALNETHLEFITKFKEELFRRGLSSMFGLVRYPGDNFSGSCEFTQGRANINLQPEDYPPDLRAFSTTWFYAEPLWRRGCTCKCNEASDDHSHIGHRVTPKA